MKKKLYFNMPYPWVRIHWIDPTSRAEWQTKKDFETFNPTTCIETGYLFEQRKGITRVFSSYNLGDDGEIDDYGNTTVIPSKLITKIEYGTFKPSRSPRSTRNR
tara:strand:- start:149 stop:460 length:312 start_codon:yes stop_codon:yes gene_type:complete